MIVASGALFTGRLVLRVSGAGTVGLATTGETCRVADFTFSGGASMGDAATCEVTGPTTITIKTGGTVATPVSGITYPFICIFIRIYYH